MKSSIYFSLINRWHLQCHSIVEVGEVDSWHTVIPLPKKLQKAIRDPAGILISCSFLSGHQDINKL